MAFIDSQKRFERFARQIREGEIPISDVADPQKAGVELWIHRNHLLRNIESETADEFTRSGKVKRVAILLNEHLNLLAGSRVSEKLIRTMLRFAEPNVHKVKLRWTNGPTKRRIILIVRYKPPLR